MATTETIAQPTPGEVRCKVIKVGLVSYEIALTCIACGDGYVMARQSCLFPVVYPVKEWRELVKRAEDQP